MRVPLFFVAALVACTDKPFVLDDTGDSDLSPSEDGSHSRAVFATVSGDYTVGGLAVVDLDDWTNHDDLTTLGADPQVQVTGDWLVQLNRGTDNSARLYTLGAFDEPALEIGLGDGSNPHDAAMCGGALYISLYGGSGVSAYDPSSGALVRTVDLSAYADDDGLPEAGSMVVLDETLYVALERLDENSTYWTSESGLIAAIDCATGEVTGATEVGPSPTITPNPSDPGTLLVRTGTYFDGDGAFTWDGALWSFDPSTGSASGLGVSEEDLEVNLGSVAAGSNGMALVLSTDESWLYTASCLDLSTGELTTIGTVDTFLSDAAVNDRDEAWVASRASWAAPEAAGGALVYDLATCTEKTAETGPITFSLEPYSVDFY